MALDMKAAIAESFNSLVRQRGIDKVTVKAVIEDCGISRQTFYYHFDDVYDLLEWVFEEDANRVLPQKVVYGNWQEDVMSFFRYLSENSTFALNVYNSNSRLYMLKYLKGRLQGCIRSFAEIVSEEQNVDRQDFEFVVEFYAMLTIGFISQWMDMGMQFPPEVTKERCIKIMESSIETLLGHFVIQ